MSSPGLYPTPTRLALLQAVANRKVIKGTDFSDYDWSDEGRNVTSRMTGMQRAGWVVYHSDLPDYGWHLTDAGRQVLEANKR